MKQIDDIPDDEITRIPLKASQHTIKVDKCGDEMVLIITPLRFYFETAKQLANPVTDPRNSLELEDY